MKFHIMARIFATLPVVIIGLAAVAAAGNIQATFHVSPSGSNANPGSETAPFKTIERARDEVRKINQNMSGDIEVVLHDGTYQLTETLVFDHLDSGSDGHSVIYKAADGATPVISGGRSVVGWQEDTAGRWKTRCGEHFRQLYVDSRRAIRARSPDIRRDKSTDWADLGFASVPGMELYGNIGYRTTDASMADWRNPGDIELCYYLGWCHTRCKVDSITGDGSHALLRMVQPHFILARRKGGLRVNLPNYVENALELLDEPGEWYLDRSDKTLYYKPMPGENIAEMKAIAPVLEKLVEMRGLLDKPVTNLQFRGITFAYATWLRPSRIGMVDLQANFVPHTLNSIIRNNAVGNVHNEVLKSPANVVVHNGKGIRFERCTFAHLGGAGLDLEYGSSDNVVADCHFHDISGSAIQVGGIEKSDHHPGDERTTVRNNQILNNLIENCAVEYMDGLGVFVGYTDSTVIAHNEIRNMPYSGISMGWGWGDVDAGGGPDIYYQPYRYDTPTTAKNNRIEYNHIHHVMTRLADGGAIYTLGNMPGTIIRGNHIHDNPGVPGGIYLDEGSGHIEITGNVVYDVTKPMNYNNHAQNRIATCNEHDNFFGIRPKGDSAPPANSKIKKIIDEAGLTSGHREPSTN